MVMKILNLIFVVEIYECKITRGHNYTLVKRQSRLDVRKYSFSQKTINVWNKVSTDCVHASSVNIIIIIIIRQPLCPVVGRRPQHAVSKLPCFVLSSAISCRSSICLGRLSTAWLVSLVVCSCHMVSKW